MKYYKHRYDGLASPGPSVCWPLHKNAEYLQHLINETNTTKWIHNKLSNLLYQELLKIFRETHHLKIQPWHLPLLANSLQKCTPLSLPKICTADRFWPVYHFSSNSIIRKPKRRWEGRRGRKAYMHEFKAAWGWRRCQCAVHGVPKTQHWFSIWTVWVYSRHSLWKITGSNRLWCYKHHSAMVFESTPCGVNWPISITVYQMDGQRSVG